MPSKKKRTQLDRNQLTFEVYGKEAFLQILTEKHIKIIQLLDEGYYQAAIAREMKISKAYVCKFVKELQKHELITVGYRNALTQRATSFNLVKELKDRIATDEVGKGERFTLAIPHKTRYLYQITTIDKPVALDVSRFAAAKFKNKKSWKPKNKGIEFHLFEMEHPRVGRIGLIVHGRSFEVYQVYRHHIMAPSIEVADNLLAMALDEAAKKFQQEMGWCGVNMELGEPRLVTSTHYAFSSRIARKITNAGQTQLQFSNGIEVDKSLEDKYGDKDVAELEGEDRNAIDIVDRGLWNAAHINQIIPDLIKTALEPLHADFLNLVAHIQSGTTLQQQYQQMQGVVIAALKEVQESRKEMQAMREEMQRLRTEKPAKKQPSILNTLDGFIIHKEGI